LFDTITLGFVGSGTRGSVSSSFLGTPSGFKSQDMVVENKVGLMVCFDLALTQEAAVRVPSIYVLVLNDKQKKEIPQRYIYVYGIDKNGNGQREECKI
jgi:hypothetical protein